MRAAVSVKRVAAVSYGLGQPPELSDSGVPIIRATNISRGTISREGLIFAQLSDLPLGRAPLLDEEEILVVRSGAYTGDSARVGSEWAGSVPGYDLRVTPFSVDSCFLGWVFLSGPWLDQVHLAKQRAAQPHLNAEDVGESTIPLHDLATQRAIADFLDAETTRIGSLVELRRRQRSSLTERLGLAIEDALRVGPELSTDVVPLRHVATVFGGLTLGKAYDGPLESRPYLRVANVQDGYLELDDVTQVNVPADTARRFELRPGDVLMLEGNGNPENLGRGTIWRGELAGCLHQNHVHVVRAGTRLVPDYLDAIVRTQWARTAFLGQSEHVGIATLSQEQIRSLPIPVPSLAVQRQRADSARRVASGHAEAVRAIDRQIVLLAERKQALITAAVTGQLDLARNIAEEAS